jgi:HxlR-like helix-turn-helix
MQLHKDVTLGFDARGGLGETDEPGKSRVPGREIARCTRRLVVTADHPRRFPGNPPLQSIGLAKNILTVRLRALVDHGILKMAPASDGSAYHEYVLTPKGRGVFPVLVALRQWSEEFSCENGGFETLLVDRNKGRPVRKLEIRAEDGRLLADVDTELRPNPAIKRRRRLSA